MGNKEGYMQKNTSILMNEEERPMKIINKIWIIAVLLVAFVAGHAYGGGCPDTTPPTIVSVTPGSAATDVVINQKIAAVFNEVMDTDTITASSFTLKKGATIVPGDVNYFNKVSVFTPAADLDPNTVYTATLNTLAQDKAGNALAVDNEWSFTTGTAADTTAPSVASNFPATDATGVKVNAKIAVAFSELIDPTTITPTTFVVEQGTTPVPGYVSYNWMTGVFRFIPDLTLLANTEYTVTITTGALDLAGNGLAVDKVWSFTTGADADTTAPTVNSTNPASGATNVALNQLIAVTFSEAMDPDTLTTATFTVKRGSKLVAGKVIYSGRTAMFKPGVNLGKNTVFTCKISTMAKDRAGNSLAVNEVWSFTTGAVADTTAPTVLSTDPVSGATEVPLNQVISATFSEDMHPATLSVATFLLRKGGVPVPGTVTYFGGTAHFTPALALEPNTVYTARIGTGVKDFTRPGNGLAAPEVWSFTTGGSTAQLPVDLGLAGNYAILAKAGISTTGTTLITGDIGVSPIDSTAITGFGLSVDASNQFATSPLVVGRVYAASYTEPTPTNLGTAVLNMGTAYTDAAGRPFPNETEMGAGEIGGLTIAPGLYKWSGNVLVTTDVTLSGCPEDVWIFQIAGDLTVANGKSVFLSGGAQAKNIFWQVAGSTVSIGSTAHMEGIVLAQNGITMNTGASWNGRALSQKAVTLIANAITEPD